MQALRWTQAVGVEAATRRVQAHQAFLEIRKGRRLACLLALTQEAVPEVGEGTQKAYLLASMQEVVLEEAVLEVGEGRQTVHLLSST